MTRSADLTTAMMAAFLILLTFSIMTPAQVYTPREGSPERKRMLDVLRVPVEKKLKQKVIFVVSHMKIQGTWAFVSGEPQNSSGGRVNLKGTAWEGSEDLFDNNFFGLLRKRGGKWTVTTYALGCTDVCYSHWWSKYRAPKTIFPYTE